MNTYAILFDDRENFTAGVRVICRRLVYLRRRMGTSAFYADGALIHIDNVSAVRRRVAKDRWVDVPLRDLK